MESGRGSTDRDGTYILRPISVPTQHTGLLASYEDVSQLWDGPRA